jgi:serine protease inhibitor
MSERRMMWAEYESADFEYDSVEDVIKRLQQLVDENANSKFRFERINIPYTDDERLYIMIEREENDREYAERIEQEEYIKKLTAERERKEYERLKAKFES